jgi:hypothetical protein
MIIILIGVRMKHIMHIVVLSLLFSTITPSLELKAYENNGAHIAGLIIGIPITFIGIMALVFAKRLCRDTKYERCGGYGCIIGSLGGCLAMAGVTLVTVSSIGLQD